MPNNQSSAKNPETYVIIPVYNEGQIVKSVVDGLESHFRNIVCVNDGSKDNSAEEVKKTNAVLISHAVNLGQGAAIQTGVEYALQDKNARYFITFDSDGQHQLEDVHKMLEVMRSNKVDIVTGSRFLGSAKDITSGRKLILKAAVLFSNATSGIKLTDAHNGLRVFNRKFAENLKITMPDMAHGSEIINRIAEGGYVYKEMPVTIKYTDYSKAKGQSALNAINITFDLLLGKVSKK